MKRFLRRRSWSQIPVLVFVLSTAASATISAFEYYSVDEIASNSTVRISRLDQFEELASRNEIDSIFVRSDDSGATSTLAFALDGVLYTLEGNGFRTIAAIRDGVNEGFPNRWTRDRAVDLGFGDFATYTTFTESWYSSRDDFSEANNVDFGNWDQQAREVILPQRVPGAEFVADLLPLLIRVKLEEDAGGSTQVGTWPSNSSNEARRWNRLVSDILDSETFEDPNPVGTTSEATSRHALGVTLRDQRDGRRTVSSLSFEGRRALVDLIAADLAGSDELSDYGIPYQLVNGEYIRQNAWRMGTSSRPESAFYLSRSFDYPNAASFIADYEDLSSAIREGYLSISDYREAALGGFSRSMDYYAARDVGISSITEYQFYSGLGVSQTEYDRVYRGLATPVISIREDLERQGHWGYAVALYAISEIPEGELFSLSHLPSRINEVLDRYPALLNLDRSYLVGFQQRGLLQLRQDESVVLSRFGTISERNGTFRAR